VVAPVIVTGASGFIGGHLVARLAASGADVTAVSRRPIEAPDGVQSVVVSNYQDTPAHPDAVLVHCAGERDAAAAAGLGLGGLAETTQMAQALVAKNFAASILLSSALVYGDDSETPHAPSDPTPATGLYAQGKLAAEGVFQAAGGSVLRLANAFGPAMAPNNVISDILGQIPGSGPLTVRDGTPIRDFVWIDDMVGALVAAIADPHPGIYNVGSGVGTSIDSLARTALAVAGEPDRPVVSTTSPGKPSVLILDGKDTEAVFGWRSTTNLEMGLRLMLEGTAT
jgi:nucleoside-diphosphate-sugar epimerase